MSVVAVGLLIFDANAQAGFHCPSVESSWTVGFQSPFDFLDEPSAPEDELSSQTVLSFFGHPKTDLHPSVPWFPDATPWMSIGISISVFAGTTGHGFSGKVRSSNGRGGPMAIFLPAKLALVSLLRHRRQQYEFLYFPDPPRDELFHPS